MFADFLQVSDMAVKFSYMVDSHNKREPRKRGQ